MRSFLSLYFLLPLMTMSAIPPYLLGLIVLYILGLKLQLFPLSGGYSPGMLAIASVDFYLDVLHHSVLPALAIVLQQVGFWALGMRGMMARRFETSHLPMQAV